jgi:hypothetical protein
MRLILDINQLDETPESLLRQAGFSFLIDRKTGSESFVRPLGRGYYPRFHLYLERQNNKVLFNLHLDQKQASYAGAHAHNAEYDGEVVEAEMGRIKDLAARNSQPVTQNANQNAVVETDQDILDKIRPKQFPAAGKKEEKKSWWRFWR